MLLVVNKVPPGLDEEVVRQRVEEAYDCPIAAVIPHDDDLMRMASEAPFVAATPTIRSWRSSRSSRPK